MADRIKAVAYVGKVMNAFPGDEQDARNRVYVVWADVKHHGATGYQVRVEHSQGFFDLTIPKVSSLDHPEALREFLQGEIIHFADNLRAAAVAQVHLSSDI